MIETQVTRKGTVVGSIQFDNPPVRVVTVPGKRLDIRHIDAFRREIEDVFVPDNQVVFDFSGVDKLDSAAIGDILTMKQELESRGRHLKMAGVGDRIYRMFEMLRIHEIFEIYDTVEEAVGSYTYP
jgi:anti-sigma B factor antagonist